MGGRCLADDGPDHAGCPGIDRRRRGGVESPVALGAPTTTGTRIWRTDALRTLNDRFARGEIDETEYTKRRDLLKPS